MGQYDHLRAQLAVEIGAGNLEKVWSDFQTLTDVYLSDALESNDPDLVYSYHAMAQDALSHMLISRSLWEHIKDSPDKVNILLDLAKNDGLADSGILASNIHNQPAVVYRDRLSELHENIVRAMAVVTHINEVGASDSDRIGLFNRLDDIERLATELQYEFNICISGLEIIKVTLSEDFERYAPEA